MSLPRYYNLNKIYINDPRGLLINEIMTMYPIEEILQIKLFDYQRDNVNWMLEFEKNPYSFKKLFNIFKFDIEFIEVIGLMFK